MNTAIAHGVKKEAGQPRLPLVPFTHAAHEHLEQVSDVSDVLVAAYNAVKGPFDVPAYGYIRNIVLLVTTSGGVDGTSTANEDWPYSVLQSVSLEDVNGAPLFGPYNGDELFYVNKYGGYQFFSDPSSLPGVAETNTTFTFAVRIPVELNARTALGCLSNMNASAAYKLRYTINAAGITAIGTGTFPTVRVRAYLEAWSLPPAQSRDGYPQAIEPPMLGTTQYWSKFIKAIASGQNTVALPRVGNQIRNIIAIFRNATPVRNDTNYADPIQLFLDARMLFNEPARYRQIVMGERYRYTRTTRDTGVYVYDFAHDGNGHPGGEDDGHLWLRTVQSSRLEFQGSFGAAGSLTVLTNDVAPVAVSDRFVETSRSGGSPGAANPAVNGN